MIEEKDKKANRGQAFVRFIINLSSTDKGAAAAVRRADNPATEYQSWEYLAAFGVDLEKSYMRLPFALIAASIAKSKINEDGFRGIGQAIAMAYEEGSQSSQAKAKLRRLLACDTIEELCLNLRPLLQLIHAKGNGNIDYAALLNDLLNFHWNSLRVKTKWAQDFYGRQESEEVSS